MKHVLLLSLALASAGCSGRGEAELLQSEVRVRRLMEAWELADTVALLDLFAPTAVYDDFANQTTYRGIEEIVGYVTGVHAWGEGVVVNVTAVHAGERSAVAEWTLAAFQERPIGSWVPVVTGREVVLNGVTVIELEGGRITRAADYMDTAPLVLQLGGRLELPGGTTITLDDVR